jgi:hypothetical protein
MTTEPRFFKRIALFSRKMGVFGPFTRQKMRSSGLAGVQGVAGVRGVQGEDSRATIQE